MPLNSKLPAVFHQLSEIFDDSHFLNFHSAFINIYDLAMTVAHALVIVLGQLPAGGTAQALLGQRAGGYAGFSFEELNLKDQARVLPAFFQATSAGLAWPFRR